MGAGDGQGLLGRLDIGRQDRVLGKLVVPVFDTANDQRQARGEATGREKGHRFCQIAGRKLLPGLLVQPVQDGLTSSLCRACDVKMAEHERLRKTRTWLLIA